MGWKKILLAVTLIAGVTAQNEFRVCVPPSFASQCQGLQSLGSPIICDTVESRLDCIMRLNRGDSDFGVFSEEEMVLMGHNQPNDNRVVASIKDILSNGSYAFEAVAVVPASHTGGLEGLRGMKYCHPGLDETEARWSPRVLKTLERAAARTDRCPDMDTNGKTAEEIEVQTLNSFFGAACRPGPWSANSSVDADLKSRFPNLCSLCGSNGDCSKYSIDMGPNIANVDNNNRHIQALECMRSNENNTFAYVAWQHVRTYFNVRNPRIRGSYALLCEDGSLRPLTVEATNSNISPCSFVRQPWSAVVATTTRASDVSAALKTWWPTGTNPGGVSWQSSLYNNLIGGALSIISFEDSLPGPGNYSQSRNFTAIDASSSCIPARRWCTISNEEHNKCSWVRASAYTLGIEPTISCQMRNNIFECLSDIKDNAADFIATPSNYGYLSRQHYKLSAVKLVQNLRGNPNSFSRVAAFVKESATQGNITRFENLRGKKACFPEFGGISYVAFLRTAHERSIISSSDCDYARAVGEFFDGACAPGALAASHEIVQSSYNATNLCSLCKPAVNVNDSNFTCAFDYTNMYYGNNGSINCLADPTTDVAFVELDGIQAHLDAAKLQASDLRALCRDNTLAPSAGVQVPDSCLLASVVDSEVLARRNDPLANSLNVLLDNLDSYFGYNAANAKQLINLEIYSPFDKVSDLLFRNTAIGLTEPSDNAINAEARNYNELFRHLESCTGSTPPLPGLATKNFFSLVTLLGTALITRFVLY
ncbi:transferrin-like [Danaus plexippus]|nr:transferrin-like [Danaus plexippus]